MVRGESESDHRSVVLELVGYLHSFAVGYITGFVGPAISKHYFKCKHAYIYKYICMAERECTILYAGLSLSVILIQI